MYAVYKLYYTFIFTNGYIIKLYKGNLFITDVNC